MQVAEILDEQNVDCAEVQQFNGFCHHVGAEMTAAVGVDVYNGDIECRNALGVARRFRIAGDQGAVLVLPEALDCSFHQACLAAASSALEAHGIHAVGVQLVVHSRYVGVVSLVNRPNHNCFECGCSHGMPFSLSSK